MSLVKSFFPKGLHCQYCDYVSLSVGRYIHYDFYLIINAYCTGTHSSNLGNNLLLPESRYDRGPCLVLVNKHSKCYEIPDSFFPLSEPAHFCHLVLKKKSWFNGQNFIYHIILKDYSIYLIFFLLTLMWMDLILSKVNSFSFTRTWNESLMNFLVPSKMSFDVMSECHTT